MIDNSGNQIGFIQQPGINNDVKAVSASLVLWQFWGPGATVKIVNLYTGQQLIPIIACQAAWLWAGLGQPKISSNLAQLLSWLPRRHGSSRRDRTFEPFYFWEEIPGKIFCQQKSIQYKWIQ